MYELPWNWAAQKYVFSLKKSLENNVTMQKFCKKRYKYKTLSTFIYTQDIFFLNTTIMFVYILIDLCIHGNENSFREEMQ